MNLRAIADELVNLCKQGQHKEAIERLYSKNIVSVEACEGPTMPREMRGIEGVHKKTQWWYDNNIVHSGAVKGPFLHGDDKFAVIFNYDVTCKIMNQRMQMEEVAVYQVAGDKIVREEFYYTMGK